MAVKKFVKTERLINIKTDQLWSLSQAARRWPGRPLSMMSVHRYARNGKGGVFLETVMVGNQRFTTDEAVDRFVEATRDYRITGTGCKPQRKKSKRRAKKILDRAGV